VWRLSRKSLCPSAVRRSNWTRPIPSPLNGPKNKQKDGTWTAHPAAQDHLRNYQQSPSSLVI
jgi:hypothetical protein